MAASQVPCSGLTQVTQEQHIKCIERGSRGKGEAAKSSQCLRLLASLAPGTWSCCHRSPAVAITLLDHTLSNRVDRHKTSDQPSVFAKEEAAGTRAKPLGPFEAQSRNGLCTESITSGKTDTREGTGEPRMGPRWPVTWRVPTLGL